MVRLIRLGVGLPFDALKKDALVAWKCPRAVEDQGAFLLDALAANGSLTRLDLSEASSAGWRAVGRSMALPSPRDGALARGLGSVQTLVVKGTFGVPVGKLRAGGGEALRARAHVLLGLWRADARRCARHGCAVPRPSCRRAACLALLSECAGKRNAASWREGLARAIAGGATPAMLRRLMAVETLRTVGITAVSTLAGSGKGAFRTARPRAQLANPFGVAVAADGSVLVADMDNHRIRKISATAAP